MLAPQPNVLYGVGGSVRSLGVCSLEQGVQGVLGVPGGCCSRSCCMSGALQGRPAAFSRFLVCWVLVGFFCFFFQMNKMGFHS